MALALGCLLGKVFGGFGGFWRVWRVLKGVEGLEGFGGFGGFGGLWRGSNSNLRVTHMFGEQRGCPRLLGIKRVF